MLVYLQSELKPTAYHCLKVEINILDRHIQAWTISAGILASRSLYETGLEDLLFFRFPKKIFSLLHNINNIRMVIKSVHREGRKVVDLKKRI